jgi:biopolymer transport protein ExbD
MVVNLPKAASAGAHVESTVNLVCTKDGRLLLNGKESNLDEVARHVKREHDANPKLQAVIAGDKGVLYGRVMDLVDLVKRNGVTAFALDVERAPLPEGN